MACPPIYNPGVPYLGYIEGGFPPGKMVRIQGSTSPSASRFAINLQCGPNTVPRDDIAFHLNARFPENCIVRNSLQNMSWGPEENYGHMPLARGQAFEILILCEAGQYKVAVNGQHFTEYPHRIPYQRVTHLSIDGDVMITHILYEGGSMSMVYAPPHVAPGFAPPLPTGPLPYPAGPSPYPVAPGPYPPASGVYPPTPGVVYPAAYPAAPYGYLQQPAPYGHGCPPGYPPVPPGYMQGSPNKGVGGILDKAGAAIGGILGTTWPKW